MKFAPRISRCVPTAIIFTRTTVDLPLSWKCLCVVVPNSLTIRRSGHRFTLLVQHRVCVDARGDFPAIHQPAQLQLAPRFAESLVITYPSQSGNLFVAEMEFCRRVGIHGTAEERVVAVRGKAQPPFYIVGEIWNLVILPPFTVDQVGHSSTCATPVTALSSVMVICRRPESPSAIPTHGSSCVRQLLYAVIFLG
jgi:hypothetical protein